MHGGVGFTWEYDCHLFYRRAKHLAVALGSPAHWREKLVQRLIAKQAAWRRNTMDFNDTPQEAEFRAAARAFLPSTASRSRPGESELDALRARRPGHDQGRAGMAGLQEGQRLGRA